MGCGETAPLSSPKLRFKSKSKNVDGQFQFIGDTFMVPHKCGPMTLHIKLMDRCAKIRENGQSARDLCDLHTDL